MVRGAAQTSSTLTLSIRAPQGCVLSPLLHSLYTYDCAASQTSNHILNFADYTAAVGLISGSIKLVQGGGILLSEVVHGQQEEERRAPTSHHQRISGGEGEQLQVARGDYREEPELGLPRQASRKTGPTVPVRTQAPEAIWPETQHHQVLL